MTNERPNCDTCPAWHRQYEERSDGRYIRTVGQCHVRSDPWPERTSDDWCAEHPDHPMQRYSVRGLLDRQVPLQAHNVEGAGQ